MHHFNNLGEIDQFLKKHPLPQLMKYEIEKLNCLVTIKVIEFIIFKCPMKKNGGTTWFH